MACRLRSRPARPEGRSWAILAAIAVLAGSFAVPSFAVPSVTHAANSLSQSAPEVRADGRASHLMSVHDPSDAGAVPEFSSGSVGEVTRTIFPGFNTSLPGSFTSSVATWAVGTPAYVPSTNTIWFPQRAVPVAGDPAPSVAPAAVFNASSGGFDRLVTNLSNASALVYDPGNGDLYATLSATDSVIVVDPSTGSLVGSPIPVGTSPGAMAFDPNTNQLFVANSGSSNLTVVDTLEDKVSIASLSVGTDPSSLAYDPMDALVFVANGESKWISVINVSNPTVPLQEIKLVFGPAIYLAYSERTDTVAAAVPSSNYATIIGASQQAAITQVAQVGLGVATAVASLNGTEFVFGNASGSDLVVLNSTTGVPIGSSIPVQPNATELLVDPTNGITYCWGSIDRILQSLDLSQTGSRVLTETDFPNLSSLNSSPGAAAVYALAQSDSLVYLLNHTDLAVQSRPILSSSLPLSVASDPANLVFFVGTTVGLTVYNATTQELIKTLSGLSGNCSRLILDSSNNLLWLSNSLLGVVAVNLTTLRVVISTGLVVPSSVTQGIAVDPTDSEVFVLASSSTVTVLNAATGDVMASGINVGTNVTSVVFDPADDQVYAAGDSVEFVNGTTLAVDGSVSPFGGGHRVLAEAYDASREAVYVTSVGLLTGTQGTVTVIDGASVASGEGPTVELPVGEEPAALTVVSSEGGSATGLSMIWVANELSGTLSVISTPPEVTYFAATPSTIDLGHSTTIELDFVGGAGSVTFTYGGLPAGCVPSSEPEWNCAPSASGEFQLTVNVTDSLGASAEATAPLTVMPALGVTATLSPSTLPRVDAGVPVVGLASALNGLPPYAYSWNFGDGAVASGPHASHAYATPGAYAVTAQIQDATGATANFTAAVMVVPRPGVEITVEPINVTDVDFPLALSSSVSGGTGTVAENWSFGDGTEAVGANVTHAWTQPGRFTSTVRCIDVLGVTANDSVNVTVHPPLTATFASGNISAVSPATVGATVTFTSTPSGGTPPYSVVWAFGDASIATGLTVEHGFATAGTFTVTATLTDAVGATVRTNLTVTVATPPSSSGAILSPGGGFATGLFLGLVLGGVLAAVVLFVAGPRKGPRTTPPPASPYVPP
jgi:DNA-binding beta-propeller fold protein YncE